jgi:hypothetical protein
VFLRPYVMRDDTSARSLVTDRYDQMRSLEESTKQTPHPVLPAFEPPLLPQLEPGTKPAPKPGTSGNPTAEPSATPTP